MKVEIQSTRWMNRKALGTVVPDALSRTLCNSLRLAAKKAQKGAWVDETETIVLLDGQQIRVAADDKGGPAPDRSRDVFVVVWIVAHTVHFVLARTELSQDDDVLKPQFRVGIATDMLTDLGVGQRSEDLLDDGRRDDDLECRVARNRSIIVGWMRRAVGLRE